MERLHGIWCVERLAEEAPRFGRWLEFRPAEADARPGCLGMKTDGKAVVGRHGDSWDSARGMNPREAHFLRLDASKPESVTLVGNHIYLARSRMCSPTGYSRPFQVGGADLRRLTQAADRRY